MLVSILALAATLISFSVMGMESIWNCTVTLFASRLPRFAMVAVILIRAPCNGVLLLTVTFVTARSVNPMIVRVTDETIVVPSVQSIRQGFGPATIPL